MYGFFNSYNIWHCCLHSSLLLILVPFRGASGCCVTPLPSPGAAAIACSWACLTTSAASPHDCPLQEPTSMSLLDLRHHSFWKISAHEGLSIAEILRQLWINFLSSASKFLSGKKVLPPSWLLKYRHLKPVDWVTAWVFERPEGQSVLAGQHQQCAAADRAELRTPDQFRSQVTLDEHNSDFNGCRSVNSARLGWHMRYEQWLLTWNYLGTRTEKQRRLAQTEQRPLTTHRVSCHRSPCLPTMQINFTAESLLLPHIVSTSSQDTTFTKELPN